MSKEGWTTVTLGDIAENISVRVNDPSKSGLERFVGLEHLDSGRVTVTRWGSTSEFSSGKRFESGDVLLCRRRPYLRKCSMAEFDGVCSGDAYVLRENTNKILPGLLKYLVNTERFWNYCIENSAGSLSPRVKWRDLSLFSFNLPTLDSQHSLLQLLECTTNRINKIQEVLELLPIVKTCFVKDIQASKTCDIVGELADCCEIIMGQSPPGSSINSENIGLPFIQGGGEFGKYHPSTENFATSGNKYAMNGDVLMTVRAPVGELNVADQKYIIGRGLCAIRSNIFGKLTLQELLRINNNHWRRRQQGSTFKAVSRADIREYPVQFPSAYNDKVEEFLSEVDNLNRITTNQLIVSVEKRNALLYNWGF